MGDKKQFSTPSAYAGNRRGRKIAGIVGGICALGIAAAVLMSFLMPASGFVTKIDVTKKAEEAALLRLRGSRSARGSDGSEKGDRLGQGTEILREQPLTSAYPVTADFILKAYESEKAKGTLDGSQIIPHTTEGQNAGIFYTFYLSNDSDRATEAKTLGYNFSLTYSNYVSTASVGASLYSYLRVLICVESEGAESHYWFAMPSATDNVEGDSREAISSWSRDISGKRSSTYADGEIYYCENFNIDQQLFGSIPNLSIAPGKETRFTVALYLEGEDPDCHGQPMVGESISVNAVFSLN